MAERSINTLARRENHLVLPAGAMAGMGKRCRVLGGAPPFPAANPKIWPAWAISAQSMAHVDVHCAVLLALLPIVGTAIVGARASSHTHAA